MKRNKSLNEKIINFCLFIYKASYLASQIKAGDFIPSNNKRIISYAIVYIIFVRSIM